MQIIPVIDLLNGMVVHAKKGDRKNYQAIQSRLSDSSHPVDIVDALLAYHPFTQLYIADLNAIQNIGNNHLELINAIAQRYPALKLWVDAGICSATALANWTDRNFNLILGSENFSDLDKFIEISNCLLSDFVLSLDYMPDGYRGPVELIQSSNYWPRDVILMSLAQVGANQGPNIDLLTSNESYTDRFNLYAAGGIRDIDDLKLLQQKGFYGALIASALHSRQISTAEITNLT